MSASYPTKLILAFHSGDRCAFPNCARKLTVDGEQSNPVVIGEAAHISGEGKRAARYDESLTEEQRNHCDNLIYLCRDHHTQIDKQEEEFPLDRLYRIKKKHEDKVHETMTEAFADVGFPELERATSGLIKVEPGEVTQDFSLIAPRDKLKKNALGIGSQNIVTMGLSGARQVRDYIESVAQTDSDFPERLKAGFLTEYFRLKQEGHIGDSLFDLMCHFAQRGLEGQANRSAGLAILVYLFEACELFEK